MMHKGKMRIFVGMSGGVDSSVSAYLLKKAGYDVTGVFIRTWQPDFVECTWKDERRDAMRVCAHLDIPFLELDAENAYRDHVAMYMIEEYKAGRTPNPDVMCNREVKFGVFWDFAKSRGAEAIATGHYAQIEKVDERFVLKRGADSDKDQSYFLWTLTNEDLNHVIFPVGHLEKLEVRKIAEKADLPVFDKKDSQGVCFLGPIDMKDFLKNYIDTKVGDVLDEHGKVVGTHDGAVFYTIGERRGFNVSNSISDSTPYFVVAKDIASNTITVAHKHTTDNIKTHTRIITHVMYSGLDVSSNTNLGAVVRYRGKESEVKVLAISEGEYELTFTDQELVLDAGQSVVVYHNDLVYLAGIVK